MNEKRYYTAQICVNGHLLTQTCDATPQHEVLESARRYGKILELNSYLDRPDLNDLPGLLHAG